ncbi:MAG: TonB-dependent receptor [Saprospiraceae bacterium]|nr:TonB-dependent receptor [Saprospiraceae bacterium]
MVKRIVLIFHAVILMSLLAGAQTALSGKVADKDNGEPIIQCAIIIFKNGIQVTTVVSDFDGNYSVQLDPGKYDVEARYVGYNPQRVTGINVLGGKVNTLNIKMTFGLELGVVDVVEYRAPLIEKDNTTQGSVITAEKIKNMPVKNINAVAATAAGLSSVDGGNAYIRGGRADATVFYLDGLRITGRQIPTSELEQLQVVTGGIEAQYGDVTGGIIALTSKGPSSKFSGGVELETSEGLDPYGYRLLSLNLSGPIWKQKLTDSTYGRTILGYRVAGQYNFQKDDDPPAYPIYRAKESSISRLTNDPLRLLGGTPTVSGQFLEDDEIEVLDYNPNEDNTAYDITAKLDFRPVENIDISISGNYSDVNNRFNPGDDNTTGQGSWTLLNWINNPVQDNQIYRGNIRLRHRLGRLVDLGNNPGEDGGAGSNIQNAYYTIQAGLQKSKSETQDWRHKDRLFDYGYIGKFPGHYECESREGVHSGWTFLVDGFDPATTTNPGYAALNEIGITEPQLLDGYRASNGRLSSAFDNTWSGLNNNVGGIYNRYNKTDNDLVTLQVTSGFDFLPGGSKSGRHNIQFGLVYEQRVSRSYTVAPFALWNLARLYTNNHISGVDTTIVVGFDNDCGDLYRNIITPSSESRFYREVRRKLLPNIPIDSAVYEYVNVNELDNNALSLDMFSAQELTDQSAIGYSGYDYLGNKLSGNAKFEDFFNIIDAEGNKAFTVAPFSPIYAGGYIQDKFTFKDIIFRLGFRVDYYDANTKVLKDPYSLYGVLSAKAFHDINGTNKPGSIGDDYKVYVSGERSTSVKAYRNGDQWYNSAGTPVNSSDQIFTSNLVFPAYIEPEDTIRSIKRPTFKLDDSFEDYDPQINFMPRLAFSFPISDNSNFFAHYDILVQRPTSNSFVSPLEYYYFNDQGRTPANNPNLIPSKTIDYEVGFQQKISNSSAIKLSAYYKELRNMINRITYSRVATVGTYDSYGNIDFGTVKGFNFTYDLRRTGNLEFTAAYTLQFADGTGSDPESQSGLTQKGINIRNIFPFNYDERHRFAFTVDYRYQSGKAYNGPRIAGKDILSNFGINFQVITASGRPYSPGTQIVRFGGSGFRGDINGARLPWNFGIDVRVDKNFSLVKGKNPLDLNIYLRVQNLLDTKNVIAVYRGSGDAKDDGYLNSDRGDAELDNVVSSYGESYIDYFVNQYNYRVLNPDNFTLPRRIFIGAILEF